jgi:hypothetical protein
MKAFLEFCTPAAAKRLGNSRRKHATAMKDSKIKCSSQTHSKKYMLSGARSFQVAAIKESEKGLKGATSRVFCISRAPESCKSRAPPVRIMEPTEAKLLYS